MRRCACGQPCVADVGRDGEKLEQLADGDHFDGGDDAIEQGHYQQAAIVGFEHFGYDGREDDAGAVDGVGGQLAQFAVAADDAADQRAENDADAHRGNHLRKASDVGHQVAGAAEYLGGQADYPHFDVDFAAHAGLGDEFFVEQGRRCHSYQERGRQLLDAPIAPEGKVGDELRGKLNQIDDGERQGEIVDFLASDYRVAKKDGVENDVGVDFADDVAAIDVARHHLRHVAVGDERDCHQYDGGYRGVVFFPRYLAEYVAHQQILFWS